jgi:CHAD domain-containing protein
MSDPLLRSIQKQVRRIRRQAKSLSKICGEVGLHALRVDLKLFRAALHLLRSVDPDFPYRKVMKPYKTVFDRAGHVRFWQIQLKILELAPGRNEAFAVTYRTLLHARVLHSRDAFQETIQQAHLPKWRTLKSLFGRSVQKCSPTAIRRYFTGLRQAAARILTDLDHISLEQRHTLRKVFREFSTNRKLALACFDFDPGPMPGMPTHNRALNELIGQWHDLQVAGVQLQEDLDTQSWPATIRQAGLAVLYDWRAREAQLWKDVVAMLAMSVT